jgi:hypothetical protein
MRRTTSGALLLLLAALPLRAQDQKGPALVSAGAVQGEVDQLHDAVASPSTDEFGVHARAAAFFDGVPAEMPVFRPTAHPMDRENVDGQVGTIDGMIDEAQRRWDHYKVNATEVPDAKLDAAIGYARVMRDRKRVEFDGRMAENQMGEFNYAKDNPGDSEIKLNARLALLSTRVGEAFSYATLVHQGAHAKSGSEGRLDPAHTIDDEVEAYRVECLWLKAIDPKAERMIRLYYGLQERIAAHPEDQVSRLAFNYVKHLIDLWDTDAVDAKLRAFVRNLGYRDGDGVDPAATALRA